ncbi:hypothetical protein KUTeg_024195 [Tegillarca granosa]|uniref:TIR domain-containing protein n=1 Tax=Tegillarca granosa TaxID=220873 RepID=A0ABQ9DWM2_TEGGR|nr:hypothetical protein KUTeg_024195 [Tegillarca granosa]
MDLYNVLAFTGIVVCVNAALLDADNVYCPVPWCFCTKHSANCSNNGYNLTFIPALPKSTRKLTFIGNWLPNVTADTFETIKNLSIEELSLQNNSISFISEDAFETLPYLKRLNLGSNKMSVDVLKSSFYGLRNSKLKTLFLPYMDLPDLPVDFFLNLQKCPLYEIQMYFNQFKSLNGLVFRPLRKLRYLHIPNNYIKSVNFTGLEHVEMISLRWNYQETVPNFCNEFNISMLPNLRVLDLGHNVFQKFKQSDFPGRCLPNVRSLSLGENIIRKIEDNTFSDLRKLERLSLTWMRTNYLVFATNAFNITSLEKLYIGNHVNFDQNEENIKLFFQNCPNLKVLDMTKIRLTYLTSHQIYTMFKPLTKLVKLVLQSTALLNLPSNLFQRMPFLENLNLKNCLIHGWQENTFKNVTSLKVLYLDHNKITSINKTSFPSEFLNSFEKLSLKVNPFTCTCDIYWFRQWLKDKTKASKLVGFPNDFNCYSPSEWNGRFLVDYDPSYELCHPISPYVILGISLSVAFVVLVLSIGLLYKYRWHIKYYIYLMRSRKGYQKISGEDDFHYDAFVVYHAKDRIWVISELLPYLENREKFKLCLHDRDFEVGELIVDNIVQKIQISRKIILILSNNFAKSHWCQFETMVAQNRLIEEGGSVLLLVMLEDLKARNISNSLHVLLKSTTFIEWKNDGPGKELFWKRLNACVRA